MFKLTIVCTYLYAHTVQVSYVVSDPSSIWSELALCERMEVSGAAELTVMAHNR